MGTYIDIDEYCRDVPDLDRRSLQKNGLSLIFNIILQKKLSVTMIFSFYGEKMIKFTY